MASQNRTGTEPATIYTFVGPAEIRASHESSDFLVTTSVEPHEDGTLRICEGSIDGIAVVWGEGLDGQIWHREDDDLAHKAVATWEATGEVTRARELSRNATK